MSPHPPLLPEQNRLVELLIDLCLYGDVEETPWPKELLAPSWDKMSPELQMAWWNSLDTEQQIRSSIAASIRALAFGGKGGNILAAERDEELGTLLKKHGQ